MRLSNNINVLPWYTSIDSQNHRQDFSNFGIFPLIALNSIPPPFQIPVSDELSMPRFSAKLFDMNGAEHSATGWVQALRLVLKDNYALLINDSVVPVAGTSLEGRYYLTITVTPDDQDPYTLYSEVITFVTSVADCLKLEYWDNQPFEHTYGVIEYDATFKNFIYLQTQVGKPSYPFEEEATKRDGYTFVEKQISEKQYQFEFIAPEFLCDALRIVRMHDNIRITNVNGVIYNIDSILITPKWQGDGDIAVVEVEFECDTVIKKIAKRFSSNVGDFNGDFNNDYNI